MYIPPPSVPGIPAANSIPESPASLAAAATAVNEGLCTREQCVSIDLDGGTLQVQVLKENEIMMTGPAAFVYEGETHIC